MKEGEVLYSSNIAICAFNVFLSYTAIILNSVTIHAMRKTSSLPETLKTLLLSLAFSDLGVGLIVQPLYVAVNVMEIEQNTDSSQCYSATYTMFLATVKLFASASFFGVMALSADRFLAIHLHLRYQELVTHKRVVAVVISMWVFSAVLSFVRLIEENISYLTFSDIVVICLLTTTLLNYKLYIAVRHHANQIQALQVQQEAQNGGIENTASLRKIRSRNILCISRVLGLLFAKLVYYDCLCNLWTKYFYEKFAKLYFDTGVSEFISQSTDLLLETESHSARCHEHSEE